MLPPVRQMEHLLALTSPDENRLKVLGRMKRLVAHSCETPR